MPCVLNDFYLNYGWKHFWCDPCTDTFPKVYVKGPFSNPKLASPLPYFSLRQTEGELLKIRTGIPDCWGEYLIHQLLGNYDSMHKEDVDIAHKLRKDYRIYLGQGIPNPCIIPCRPGFLNCKGLKENLRKFLFQISENKIKNRRGNCLCCEKNYILECPDKTNTKNRTCSCRSCHPKDVDFGDECRCIEILQNWVSEDVHLKERRRSGGRKTRAKNRGCSSGSSGCETDDEGTVVSSRKTCICPKDLKMAFNSISSGNSNASCMERESKREEYIFGKDFLYKGFTEKKGGFGFFPYAGNIHRGGKRLRFKDIKGASKQIQTESRAIGDTKKVQTENAENKMQSSNKCFRCTLYQHQYSTCKPEPFENALCVSPGFIKNHAIICPYTCHDQKSHWLGSPEKKQKKKEIAKTTASGDHQKNSKMEDNILNKYKISDGFKTSEAPKAADFTRTTKTADYQPCLKSFDNMKYLTDSRLKNYLLERETLRRLRNKTSQTLNDGTKFSRKEPSPREKLEKFKFLHRSEKIARSSSAESLRKAEERAIQPKYVDRGVMAGGEERTRKKELITKYFKKVFESDDSRTYGLVRSRESNRKRRKLVCNRKRKKACGRKKSENRTSKLVSKIVQVEWREDNGKFSADDEEKVKFRECDLKYKQMEEEQLKKSGHGSLVELFNRRLRSEQRGAKRTDRSPDVMKFIVGDLIIDEKSKT